MHIPCICSVYYIWAKSAC